MREQFNLTRVENGEVVLRSDLSLWQIWENRKHARAEWVMLMSFNFGAIPTEIIVSKVVYQLIYVYQITKRPMAAGNWLGLNCECSYCADFDDDIMMLRSIEQDRTLAYLCGGKAIEINYGNFKETKCQK